MNKELSINFIGIGAQKAATSWIAECLKDHPQIYLCPSKEVHFFSTDSLYAKGVSAYYKQFGKIPQDATVGEFSTTYLSSLEAPERIHDLFPHIKLIVSLRNPGDRALSHIEHLISRGVLERGISLEAAVTKRRDIVQNSMYGIAMKRYLQLFSREQIHVVLYDDIEHNPKAVIKSIYQFLGVHAEFTPRSLRQRFNTAEIRSSLLYRLQNKLHFYLMRSYAGRYAQKLFKRLGVTSQRSVKLLSTIHAKKKYAAPHDAAYLQKLFDEDIQALEKILSIDLSSWKNIKT